MSDWDRDWPAPAKINLFLHVVGRRADGYHQLQTVFRFLDYGDTLRCEPRSDDRIVLAAPRARSSWHTTRPSRSGNPRSNRTRSTGSAANAAAPVRARSTSNPSRWSPSTRGPEMETSSSTTSRRTAAASHALRAERRLPCQAFT